MGYFYFDETIQERGGFIIGAFIYTEEDITPDVYSAIEQVGLQPGIDEYKSGSRMDRNPRQAMLRIQLSQSLRYTKVGLVVLPANERALLGNEAIIGLQKILRANKLDQIPHKVFVDEGIAIDSDTQRLFLGGAGSLCELYTSHVGARLKIPRSGRCRITQNEGSLNLTDLLISVAHLHRSSCVGSALNEHSPRG